MSTVYDCHLLIGILCVCVHEYTKVFSHMYTHAYEGQGTALQEAPPTLFFYLIVCVLLAWSSPSRPGWPSKPRGPACLCPPVLGLPACVTVSTLLSGVWRVPVLLLGGRHSSPWPFWDTFPFYRYSQNCYPDSFHSLC